MLYYYQLNPKGIKRIEAALKAAQSKPASDPDFKNRQAFLNHLLKKPLFDPYSFYLTEEKFKQDDIMGHIIGCFTKLKLETGSIKDGIPSVKQIDLRKQAINASYQKRMANI